jgi:xanthine dehydrogenase molybdopterin-binding subunit B
MEPLNAVASVDSDGTTAEVWCGTQAPTVARRAVARALDTTEEKIVLHPMLLGGGFLFTGHRTLRIAATSRTFTAKDSSRRGWFGTDGFGGSAPTI